MDNLIWKSKDGSSKPVYKMDDTHLMNTIKMLERKYPGQYKHQLKPLINEMNFRGLKL